MVGRVSFLLRVPTPACPPAGVINSLTSPRRCGWREASSDKKARAGQRSGRFQHQDATPHPHRAAQRQSRQPGEEEPQEEGGRHRHHNLLPVGRRQLHVCVCVCVCVCVWFCVTDWQCSHSSRICSFITLKSGCGVFFPPDPKLTSADYCVAKQTVLTLCLDCRPTGVQCFI